MTGWLIRGQRLGHCFLYQRPIAIRRSRACPPACYPVADGAHRGNKIAPVPTHARSLLVDGRLVATEPSWRPTEIGVLPTAVCATLDLQIAASNMTGTPRITVEQYASGWTDCHECAWRTWLAGGCGVSTVRDA
jgi:hypothetical protein